MPSNKREYTSSSEDEAEGEGGSIDERKPITRIDNDSDFDPSLVSSPSPKKAKISKLIPPIKAKTKSSTSNTTPTKPKPKPKGQLSPKPTKESSTPARGQELKMLYTIMCPKRVGVNWTDVASQLPGRDGKACQNKWARMQGKLMQAIEDLGE
ncbi:hypothetical protein IAT40_000948 [Kwoniella sp. CBS 6097]